MVNDEFAPITPGTMLKDEFLAEYGLSQNQLARAIGISPNRIAGIVNNRRRITRGHGAALGPVFRQQPGILAEPSDPLRSQDGTARARSCRGKTHQRASRCVKSQAGELRAA